LLVVTGMMTPSSSTPSTLADEALVVTRHGVPHSVSENWLSCMLL